MTGPSVEPRVTRRHARPDRASPRSGRPSVGAKGDVKRPSIGVEGDVMVGAKGDGTTGRAKGDEALIISVVL